jgi:hypothetical protein
MGFLSSIFGSTEPHGEDGKSVVVNGKVVGLGDFVRVKSEGSAHDGDCLRK